MRVSDCKPRVSIVLPTRGRAQRLAQTLPTILAQTFTDFELLIKQDGPGDDGTNAVLAGVRDDRICASMSGAPLGIPGILNTLVAEARGEYIIVLHDHDLFEPTLLAAMVEALDRHPSTNYVHSGLHTIDQDDRVTGTFVRSHQSVTAGREWAAHMLTRMDSPVCACSLVRRSAYERFGAYDPSFGFVADVDLWFRLAMHGDVAYVSSPEMRIREREPGHEYRGLNWTMVEALVAIHRKYAALLSLGVGARVRNRLVVERFVAESFLRHLKYYGFSSAARATSRRHLRTCGTPLSRALATLT